MEIGAIKHSFNNEVIHIKKKLNQAKIQIINNLTRKAKTLKSKNKLPENLKNKLTRKAESAVAEVLFIKTIKAKDLVKFAVTHKGNLADYLNKPTPNSDKASARILLHKCLQQTYKELREKYGHLPIDQLLMSKKERLKIKKELAKKTNQKQRKDSVSSGNDWNVQDIINNIKPGNEDKVKDDSTNSENEDKGKNDFNNSENEDELKDDSNNSENRDDSADDLSENNTEDSKENSDVEIDEIPDNVTIDSEQESLEEVNQNPIVNIQKTNTSKPDLLKNKPRNVASIINDRTICKLPKKLDKTVSTEKPQSITKKIKSTKQNIKLMIRKVKLLEKTTAIEVAQPKVVDSFFLTSSGENYMTLAEPRQPDEVKEVHSQGNRAHRRAVKFGNVPKKKQNNSRESYFSSKNGAGDKFGRQNGKPFRDGSFQDASSKFGGNDIMFGNKKNRFDNGSSSFTQNTSLNGIKPNKSTNDSMLGKRGLNVDADKEKLHPSWEAKKQKSGIVAFKGKKVVFD